MSPALEARKADAQKPPMQLLPYDALVAVARVLGHGAEKYGARNWEAGMDWSRMAGAAQRHLAEFMQGRDADADSGLPHLAHLACDALFLLAHQLRGVGVDDRPTKSVAETVLAVAATLGPQAVAEALMRTAPFGARMAPERTASAADDVEAAVDAFEAERRAHARRFARETGRPIAPAAAQEDAP